MNRLIGACILLFACGANRPDAPESGERSNAVASVPVAPAPTDACGWISAQTATEVIGALSGEPRVVRSVERPQPDSTGGACRYDLGAARAVVLQVDLSGGIIEEQVGGSMVDQFREALGASSSEPPPVAPGWDRTGKLMTGYSTFSGRVGHIAISAAALSPGLDTAVTAALARRVRDAIPDLPFELPRDPQLEALAASMGGPIADPPTGPNPCELIDAAEAEAVLGNLLLPPYRSADAVPLADAAGTSCSYYTKGHRAFVVRPRWDSGKMLFRRAVGVSGAAGAVVGADAGAADTLEGAWEESTSNPVTGQLYFLRGDRMLEVTYLTSSTDMAGALRLAGIAMRKL